VAVYYGERGLMEIGDRNKYESMRCGWCSKEVMGTYGVGFWKHIRRGCDKFFNFVFFEVRVGSK
jgi:hypothetical protein